MFDNKKQPVEDMFAGTDQEASGAAPATPLASDVVRPTPPSGATQPSALPKAPRGSGGFGVVKVAFVAVVVLALIAGAAYAAYKVMMRQSTDGGILESVSDDGVVGDEEDSGKQEEESGKAETEEESQDKGTFLDNDGDGLTNAEELEAGTSLSKPDTDSDGLGDREEVEVYGTDPNDPDTDGDSYLDGQEVAGGYNPNGEGKLFTVPSD